MQHLWNKFKNWCINTWHQLDNWQTLVLFVIVVIVMYSPVWGGYLLYYLFHWKWAMWAATGVLAFWAAPGIPFFPVCITITLAIKKAWLHVHDRALRILKKTKKDAGSMNTSKKSAADSVKGSLLKPDSTKKTAEQKQAEKKQINR